MTKILDVEFVHEHISNFKVIDVRTEDEWNSGHIKNSKCLDIFREDFKDKITKLDKDVKYLVHCKSGGRTRKAIEMMEELRFTDLNIIDGDLLAWREKNYELV